MTEQTGKFDEEIESWRGFPWALRKEDLKLWNAMTKEARDRYGEAVEKSDKTFTTDPLFMALLLAQQRLIKRLHAELVARGAGMSDPDATVQIKLDQGSVTNPKENAPRNDDFVTLGKANRCVSRAQITGAF